MCINYFYGYKYNGLFPKQCAWKEAWEKGRPSESIVPEILIKASIHSKYLYELSQILLMPKPEDKKRNVKQKKQMQ